MLKYRQEIIVYTFRNYTRQRIRQLLSYPFNENMSSYQENMLLCQRVLAVGFLTWVITSHFMVKYLVALNSLSISIGGETMTAQVPFPSPPFDFGVEANGFMYCPTACTYSSELVRGKQGVYISGYSANWNYLLQNSNIHVLPQWNTPQILCLVLEIKLQGASDQQVILSV